MSFLSSFGVKTDVGGLDIGPTNLRMAQLKYPKQHASLVALSEVSLPKKIFEKDTIVDTDSFSSALATLLESASPQAITAKAVVAALPETFIFTRIVQLPHLAPNELKKALNYEIGQYLPVPVEGVYYDYTPLALRQDKQQLDIAIFAAPKTLVDPLIDVIHSQGLELYALETKATAATRALILSGSNSAALIIEIGNGATRLTVVDHGNVWLTTSLPCGEEQITKVVAEKTGHDQKSVRQELSKADAGAAHTALKAAIDPIVQEVVSITRYHETRDYEPSKLDRTIIVGQGASLPKITELLTEALHRPCEPGSPLVGNAQTLDLKYAIAIGLAMRTL